MKEEDLVDLLRKIFKTDASIDLLSKIEPEGFETLIACKRGRIEQGKGRPHSSKVNLAVR
jgi:hypothetical protein